MNISCPISTRYASYKQLTRLLGHTVYELWKVLSAQYRSFNILFEEHSPSSWSRGLKLHSYSNLVTGFGSAFFFWIQRIFFIPGSENPFPSSVFHNLTWFFFLQNDSRRDQNRTLTGTWLLDPDLHLFSASKGSEYFF